MSVVYVNLPLVNLIKYINNILLLYYGIVNLADDIDRVAGNPPPWTRHAEDRNDWQ